MTTSTIAARTGLHQFRSWENPDKEVTPPPRSPVVDQYTKCEREMSDFFCCLSEATLKALQKIKHTTTYPTGTIIFTEGQAVRGIYVVCQGQVKLLTTNSDGRTLILKIARPGEGLGLNSVITGRPYELTAKALQPSQLTFVARADYLKFITEHTDACLQVGRHLSRDCESVYDLVRSIGLCQAASGRLARFLLKWSSNGPMRDCGVQVKLGLTHEEMAELIGTSRETVTRTLSEFKRQRFIELNGSTLLLWNKPALEDLAAN